MFHAISEPFYSDRLCLSVYSSLYYIDYFFFSYLFDQLNLQSIKPYDYETKKLESYVLLVLLPDWLSLLGTGF